MGADSNRLRELAETMTQAEAARECSVSRSRIGQIAKQYGITFVEREVAPASSYCSRCRRKRHVGYDRCLRCYWTVSKIRQLRRTYGLSQKGWSVQVLKMNIWAAARWESGSHKPNRISLVLLEQLEDEIENKA